MPKVDHREIDTAFGFGQSFQVTAKILGVFVDQGDQLFHQLAQGPVPREFGDDDEEAGAAAGEDFKRPHLACAYLVAADLLPQTATVVGRQRLQIEDPE